MVDAGPNIDNDLVEAFYYDHSGPAICGGAQTTRYGFDLIGGFKSMVIFDGPDAADLYYYSDDQLLSGVSVYISLRSYCNGCYQITPYAIDTIGDTYQTSAGMAMDTYDVGTSTTQSVYSVQTGTFTVDMYGTNWTIGKLKDYKWHIRINEQVWLPAKPSLVCGDLDPYVDCICDDVDVYIEEFEVRFAVP